MSGARRTSFVVRVVQTGPGQLNGIIEQVATGAKEAFTGAEAIGPAIERMLRREDGSRPAGARGPASETAPAPAPQERKS